MRGADEAQILALLAEMGAILTNDHLVYTSGKHGSAYVNKDAVYPHTEIVRALCHVLALRVQDLLIDAVIAPVIGGVVLSFQTAQELTQHKSGQKEVICTYAEKAEGGFIISRGFDRLLDGKLVLVVEDVLTTGGSVAKVVEALRQVGGIPAAVAVLCNRGGVKASVLGVDRLESLVNVAMDAWDEAECPLCAQGVPVNVTVGKGRQFLARKQH